MKLVTQLGLSLVSLLACITVWILSCGLAKLERRSRTCQGKGTLEVIVTDSLERRFVSREDIESWLTKEYRAYAGLPLDSVNLGKIENIIQGHSAVRNCEAWLTDDGILHISISQREPVVRFQDGSFGYYADQDGFLFPLQARGSVQVPVIDGAIPLKVPQGFKGTPSDQQQQEWLSQVIGMVNIMSGTIWAENISQISVRPSGDLVFIPREGKERFIFGSPTRVREKLSLIETYYQSVAPLKTYSSVDVRYRKQLVCKE